MGLQAYCPMPPPPATRSAGHTLFAQYDLDGTFDEMFEAGHAPRQPYGVLFERLCEVEVGELRGCVSRRPIGRS
jgi:hypothetical protein